MDTKNIPYYFHNTVVVRTPMYPAHHGATAETIFNFFKADIPAEALYLASPVLYHEYRKWLEGKAYSEKEMEKLVHSLARYYYRMRTRCTPFGLLATISTARWENAPSSIILDDPGQIQRRNRLDMFTVCNIQEALLQHEDVLHNLVFYPNGSIYRVGEYIRYIEYTVTGEFRNHQITSVRYSEYLELILQFSRSGVRLGEIADMLTGHEIDREDALDFAVQLAQSQILISELEPNTTGEYYFDRIIAILERIQQNAPSNFTAFWLNTLREVDRCLISMDGAPKNHSPVYKEIQDRLERGGLEVLEARLCQADSWRPLRNGVLNTEIQEKFRRVLWLLNKLFPFKAPEAWQAFVQKFSERYENEEIPILRVLDDELGLGFGNTINQDDNPISKNIQTPLAATYSTTTWTDAQTKMFNLLLDAFTSKDYVLRINPAVFGADEPDWNLLPPSFSFIFRIVEDGKFWIETAGNASAANLNGRFAFLHEELRQLIQDICAKEQELNEDIIFAEIVHLPGSRVGNILLRPALRNYEIPILAQASVGAEYQLPLDDLYVSALNGRIVLRSKKLNKYIIPKLTTAHNYHYLTQPLYKFLCDLQIQDFRFWLTFNLSDLGNQMAFRPRVEFEDFILSPATWYLTNEDFAGVIKAKNTETRLAEMAKLRERFNMPRFLSLIEADIDMIVDTEDPLLVNVLADDIKYQGQILLREYLAPTNAVAKDLAGNTYANQFIATVIRKTPVYEGFRPWRADRNPNEVQRLFAPGDRWVYYKVYTGVKSADSILTDTALPMVRHFKSMGWIDRWFFIRYYDPDNHLRLRFQLTDPTHFQQVVSTVCQQFKNLLEDGTVWKIQLDSYRREIERYGVQSMELSEQLFDADSTATVYFLSRMNEEQSEDIRWIWAMKTTDQLLDALGYGLGQKIGLMSDLKHAFAREFRMENTQYLKQLSRSFREEKDRIRQFMQTGPTDTHSAIPAFFGEALALHQQLVEQPCNALRRILENSLLEFPPDMLVSSYIHMKFNRIFPTYQRKNEMVFYDFLYQSLKSSQYLIAAEV